MFKDVHGIYWGKHLRKDKGKEPETDGSRPAALTF